MALSAGQRLRKAAAKAARRKAVVAGKRALEKRDQAIAGPRDVDLASSPIVHCSLSPSRDGEHVRELTLVRKLAGGRYAVAVFVIDFFCLGIKDAFFELEKSADYEKFQENLEATGLAEPLEPARARLLVQEAAAYGAANGVPPHPGFAEQARLFGVDPAGESFVFGDNGRPHYIVDPWDTEHEVDEVLRALSEKLGPGGFDVTHPPDEETD